MKIKREDRIENKNNIIHIIQSKTKKEKKMNTGEKKLFFALCRFCENTFDEKLLDYATANVLGHLFFNRMQGIAYGTLKNHDLLCQVNREFRNALSSAYAQNEEKNEMFFLCLQQIRNILWDVSCAYVMLKGAVLCKKYPSGYRTSNDIDLLVKAEDVSKIGRLLKEAGFKQGNIRNGRFMPATRKEIIASKMLRGETVPYIKYIGLAGIPYLEVDINFSLDAQNTEDKLVDVFLDRRVFEEINDLKIFTLDEYDFFIHLCAHLHKEATTMPWIAMKRDMTLYKYVDIYFLLMQMSPRDIERIFYRAKKLQLEKICAYAILETANLFSFEEHMATKKAKLVLKEKDFLLSVWSPQDRKVFLYKEKNTKKRFFAKDRKKLLEEKHEKT